MSDPRTGNGALSATATANDGQQDKLSQPTGSQRGVRSTRTPATRTATSTTTRDARPRPQPEQPHRSQTVPMPTPSATEARTRRTPTSQSTMPIPSTMTRQRTPSNPRAPPGSSSTGPTRPPELPNPHPEAKGSLVGTDYIVEPLASSFRDQEKERRDPAYLSPYSPTSVPMPTPMLASDKTHSTSSYQTTSYYSVEDNWSSVAAGGGGGGPPMPQTPEHRDEERAPENQYEDLWLASQANTQAPPMPTPQVASPPMPSPSDSIYTEDEDEDEGRREAEEDRGEEEEERGEDLEEEEDEDHPRPHSREPPVGGSRPYAPPTDRYDSSWLAAPSPGMPVPSAASPPMPSPSHSTGQPGQRIPSSQGSARIEYPQPSSSPTRLGPGVGFGVIPSTAPLRVHHNPRPTGIGPTSPAPSNSNAGPTTPTTPSQPQPSPHRVNAYQQQPSATSTTLKPQADHPTAATPAFTSSSKPSDQKYVYEPRPSGASAPGIPSARTNANAAQKPVSVYAQHPLSNVPVKTQSPPNSASLPGGRFEGRPTVPTSTSTSTPIPATPTTTPPQPPQKATPIQEQPTSSLYQPSRPTTTAPTAVSSNASQKPSTRVSQAPSTMTTSRPQTQAQQVSSETRPNRPSVSAPSPQVQQQGPTSASAPKEKDKEPAQEQASHATDHGANPIGGNPTQHTQYVNMLLALDDIPALYNLLSGFFTWILLAGFILFPGTFTSLQTLNAGGSSGLSGQVEQTLIHAVTNLPLFIVAWVCTGVGAVGMIWLWWRWRKNYLWATNKIFLPGLLNSLAGLLSTIANIFGVQHGELSTTSKSTLIVTSAATGVLGILVAFYTFWLVRRVKAKHDREVGKERAGKYGEGVVDLSKRR